MLFILTLALHAIAGLPDEDAFTSRLRKEFASAHAPSRTELALGKTWYCDEQPAARKQAVGVRDGVYFRFKEQGKDGKMYKNKLLPSWQAHRILSIRESEALVGYGTLGLDPIEDTRYIYYIRATADGRLLVESAARPSALKKPNENYVQALSKDSEGELSLRVRSYAECKRQLPVNPR